MLTLEKIDKIVDRTGCTFEEARDALKLAQGDIIEAIIAIQSAGKAKNIKSGKSNISSEIIEKLKAAIRKGNVSRVVIEHDGDVILNIPVTVGAIGVVLAPVVAVIGLGATMINKINIKVVDSYGKETPILKKGLEPRDENIDSPFAEDEFEEVCEWSEDKGHSCDEESKTKLYE